MAAGAPRAELADLRRWLVDTGPLVAYLDAGDPEHAGVAGHLDAFTGKLYTTSAVIVEALHFLAGARGGPALLVEFVDASGLEIHGCTETSQLRQAISLMEKYADIPMDFADATLVLLAEKLSALDIVTLDRRGFAAYRTSRGKALNRILDRR